MHEEILEDFKKWKEDNKNWTFLEFLDFMMWVEFANAILTHIQKSAYEQAITSIKYNARDPE